jgi:hypothetical protein
MICKRIGCGNVITKPDQAYCSESCAPFARLSNRGPSPDEIKKRLNREEILAFQKRARYVAKKRGYPELADDFAQEIFIAFSRGWRSTIDQLFTSFLRKEHGDPRVPGGRARGAARFRTISLDERSGENEDAPLYHEVIGSAVADPGVVEDLGRFGYLFRGNRFVIFELVFINYHPQEEIAEIFGVTESRICQIVNGIRRELRDAIGIERFRENLESDPRQTELEVEWLAM